MFILILVLKMKCMLNSCLRCGLAAVQLAKAMDAGHIAGVCSGKNEAIVSMF